MHPASGRLATEEDAGGGRDTHHGAGLVGKLARAGAAGANLTQEGVEAQNAYPEARRTTAQIIATPSTVVAVVQTLGWPWWLPGRSSLAPI